MHALIWFQCSHLFSSKIFNPINLSAEASTLKCYGISGNHKKHNLVKFTTFQNITTFIKNCFPSTGYEVHSNIIFLFSFPLLHKSWAKRRWLMQVEQNYKHTLSSVNCRYLIFTQHILEQNWYPFPMATTHSPVPIRLVQRATPILMVSCHFFPL